MTVPRFLAGLPPGPELPAAPPPWCFLRRPAAGPRFAPWEFVEDHGPIEVDDVFQIVRHGPFAPLDLVRVERDGAPFGHWFVGAGGPRRLPDLRWLCAGRFAWEWGDRDADEERWMTDLGSDWAGAWATAPRGHRLLRLARAAGLGERPGGRARLVAASLACARRALGRTPRLSRAAQWTPLDFQKYEAGEGALVNVDAWLANPALDLRPHAEARQAAFAALLRTARPSVQAALRAVGRPLAAALDPSSTERGLPPSVAADDLLLAAAEAAAAAGEAAAEARLDVGDLGVSVMTGDRDLVEAARRAMVADARAHGEQWAVAAAAEGRAQVDALLADHLPLAGVLEALTWDGA